MKPTVRSRRVRLTSPVALALAVVSGLLAVTAFAAGMDLESKGLGVSGGAAAACDDSSISARFGGVVIPAGTTHFVVNEVVLSNVASQCNGAQYIVTIYNSAKQALNTTSGTLNLQNGTAAITLTGSGAPVALTEAKGISTVLVKS